MKRKTTIPKYDSQNERLMHLVCEHSELDLYTDSLRQEIRHLKKVLRMTQIEARRLKARIGLEQRCGQTLTLVYDRKRDSV